MGLIQEDCEVNHQSTSFALPVPLVLVPFLCFFPIQLSIALYLKFNLDIPFSNLKAAFVAWIYRFVNHSFGGNCTFPVKSNILNKFSLFPANVIFKE